MKLSDYAKKKGISYDTAWRMWNRGQLQGERLPTGTIIIFGLISMLAGETGRVLSKSERVDRVLNLMAGTVFAGLAVKLALIQQK